jgi:hypothetical protein
MLQTQYLVKPTNITELKTVQGILYLTALYKGNRQESGKFLVYAWQRGRVTLSKQSLNIYYYIPCV